MLDKHLHATVDKVTFESRFITRCGDGGFTLLYVHSETIRVCLLYCKPWLFLDPHAQLMVLDVL